MFVTRTEKTDKYAVLLPIRIIFSEWKVLKTFLENENFFKTFLENRNFFQTLKNFFGPSRKNPLDLSFFST